MSRSEYVTLPLREAPGLPRGELCDECGKHRYATREGAERIMRRAQLERGETDRTEARAYYDHGWWHLTSAAERY